MVRTFGGGEEEEEKEEDPEEIRKKLGTVSVIIKASARIRTILKRGRIEQRQRAL